MKPKRMSMLAVCLLTLFALPTPVLHAHPDCGGAGYEPMPERKAQSECPIDGGALDRSVYLDFQAQRIYFCCAPCREKFQAEPEPAMKKIEAGNVLLESIQTVCPLCGEPIDKGVFQDYKGRRVYFCGSECGERFMKSPDSNLLLLETQEGERKFGCGTEKRS